METTEEYAMEPNVVKNIFESGMGNGGGMGGGLGAGLLGGVVGGALLGNNGILGNNRNGVVDGLVTPTMLTTALNQVQDNTNAANAASERLTMSRFDAESQREIQASIERTAAATQLASAVQSAALGVDIAKSAGESNVQIALTSGATQTQAALLAGNLSTQNALNAAATQTLLQKAAGDLGTAFALGDARTQQAIATAGTASALAFKDVSIGQLNSQYVLSTAIKADGDLTRGLIVSQNDAMLNRLLTTAQNEIIELRGDREGRSRAREVEVNVTQNQTNLMNQQQQQAQFQSQAIINERLVSALNNLQVATATNQSLIIGNSGFTAGGPQTANPVNVRA